MTQPPRIEAGTARLFSVQYSASPSVAPWLAVTVDSVTTVYSVTATSATTAYRFQDTTTVPTTPGVYAFAWTATFSGNPDITPGLFQVVKTRPWTV